MIGGTEELALPMKEVRRRMMVERESLNREDEDDE
jgi:hypothetical protein